MNHNTRKNYKSRMGKKFMNENFGLPKFEIPQKEYFHYLMPQDELQKHTSLLSRWIMGQDEKQIAEHLAKVSCDAFNRLYKVMTEIEIKRALTQYELDRVMQTQAQCQTGAQNKEGENLQHLTAKGTALETPPV